MAGAVAWGVEEVEAAVGEVVVGGEGADVEVEGVDFVDGARFEVTGREGEWGRAG